MATELLIEITVEPSIAIFDTATADPAVAQEPILKRLECSRWGRGILSCMRWGLVFGLILSGYCVAEMVNVGVQFATKNSPTTAQPILASAQR